jgi:hypothetical protein
MYAMTVSDHQFEYFLATLLPSQLTEPEWRLFKFYAST